MRFYVSNHSYPELREVESRWERHRIWWRAFRSAGGDVRFWIFAFVQAIVLLSWLAVSQFIMRRWGLGWAHTPLATLVGHAVAIALWGILMLSWGGDLMRPHLRRVSPSARVACPECGQLLTGQLAGAAGRGVSCPECGEAIPGSVFRPPYEIPRRFRALRWRRSRSSTDRPLH
ncbi:MAG: hypothetical protein HKO59_10465 [Phycisphaerales bacterium]|nr:hypothetical protein [Phycisphaerales bacterium]NNM26386.1 hypothetical protein [Phycisphaerales bacterium]